MYILDLLIEIMRRGKPSKSETDDVHNSYSFMAQARECYINTEISSNTIAGSTNCNIYSLYGFRNNNHD